MIQAKLIPASETSRMSTLAPKRPPDSPDFLAYCSSLVATENYLFVGFVILVDHTAAFPKSLSFLLPLIVNGAGFLIALIHLVLGLQAYQDDAAMSQSVKSAGRWLVMVAKPAIMLLLWIALFRCRVTSL